MSSLYSEIGVLLAIVFVIGGAAVGALWSYGARPTGLNEVQPTVVRPEFRASLVAARHAALQRNAEAKRARKAANAAARRKSADEKHAP